MGKTGRENKRYSTEFKMCVIMDMREHRLNYHETVRKHWGTKHIQKIASKYDNLQPRSYMLSPGFPAIRAEPARQRHTRH